MAVMVLAISNVAVAAAATPQPAPKLVGDECTIWVSSTDVPMYQSIAVTVHVTDSYGNPLAYAPGYLTSNGYYVSGTSFTTDAYGNAYLSIYFYTAGEHYIAANCDGLNPGLYVNAY